MSIVARVFIVLNLILSVIFLIAAMHVWTAKTKWQKMYEKERQANIERKFDSQKRLIELSEQDVRLEEVIKQRKADIVNLRLNLNDARDQKLELQGKLGEAESRANMQQAQNEELTRELSRRAEELVKLKGVLLKQQQAVQVARDNEVKARNEKAEMENELNATKQTLGQLQRDKRTIEEDLALQNRRIEALIERGMPVVEMLGDDQEATQPFIADAQVLAVKPDLDLIMLSVGSAQGVKPGYRFTIQRGDQYISKAQVERVYPDMCSARLLLKKGEVQVHDEAKTRVAGSQ